MLSYRVAAAFLRSFPEIPPEPLNLVLFPHKKLKQQPPSAELLKKDQESWPELVRITPSYAPYKTFTWILFISSSSLYSGEISVTSRTYCHSGAALKQKSYQIFFFERRWQCILQSKQRDEQFSNKMHFCLLFTCLRAVEVHISMIQTKSSTFTNKKIAQNVKRMVSLMSWYGSPTYCWND